MPSDMDHDRFGSTPGNHWDTKRQCQMLLKDDEAYPDEKSDGKGITIWMISELEGCLKANALTLKGIGVWRVHDFAVSGAKYPHVFLTS